MIIDRDIIEKLIVELGKDLNYANKFDEVLTARGIEPVEMEDQFITQLASLSDFILVEMLEAII